MRMTEIHLCDDVCIVKTRHNKIKFDYELHPQFYLKIIIKQL